MFYINVNILYLVFGYSSILTFSSIDGKKIGLVPIKKIRLTRRVVESSVFTGQDAVQLFDAAHASENDLYD